MIKRYIKKPFAIKAVQFTEDTQEFIVNWLMENLTQPGISSDGTEIYIKTLEGEMTLSLGNYLIQGVEGEFYPCGKDIFERTYVERPDIPEDTIGFIDHGDAIEARLEGDFKA